MNNLEVVIDTEKRSSLLNKVQILSQPVHVYYVIYLKNIKNKQALILNKNTKGGT
ncbi:hypothetical protein [Heyndrickxia oleronia]|jgi:hypothetical protein|uniref:hypothetical protein n=1 Tax=Heyndrickxia oleronia TaxID=38875 RepID=UPI00242DB122|nr:hypothetical protein [Heyndrickxia oleronia]MCI1590527.1 hypothetical protein [Heyndrickxia oleronia]MCI1612565.1 hypothetical protein [Heyndrickxia oleronia]MCI1743792.1 hypothetical protein [Heyndrickxia oleronia]MCI1760502.1 hypothetical protein [Heyndrickxia oleronia]